MRHKDPQKESVLKEEAIKMIDRYGFDGFSLKKLAKSAGLSSSTIYVYFESKEELLSKLYNWVQEEQAEALLYCFDPQMSLREGLWVQWKNRYRYAINNPVHYRFMEQFKNSPLIYHSSVQANRFKETMGLFFKRAITIPRLSAEVIWAIAFGPLYTLINFDLEGKKIGDGPSGLNEKKLKQGLDMVLKSFEK
jgi:TetR/AcrR family transcriptional repressor of multidrug resistance operon